MKNRKDEMKNKKTKQISYFSIMVLVVAGTVGAGIFFKNQTLSKIAQGNFGIVMATWGVGIVGMLAIALSLVEVTSAQKTNKGTLEWVKLFTPKWFSKSSSNYVKWVYIPLTLLTMPLYVTNALEDAGLPIHSELAALGISFAIFMWFMLTNLISVKFAEVSQWVTTAIQLIPLVALPIIGLVHAGNVSSGTIMDKQLPAGTGLTGVSPWLAIIAGVSAIAFAYDGFYAITSLRDEMKEPEKVGRGLAGGVILISVVYLFIAIGFNVAGNGSIYGMNGFISESVFKFFSACIAIGVTGIVNSFIMAAPRQFADMIKDDNSLEFMFTQRVIFRKRCDYKNKSQRYLAGWTFSLVSTVIAFIILGSVGAYAYTLNAYGTKPNSTEVYGGNHSYAFADTLTSYTSLLMFVIVAASILGAIINRKTNKVKVTKSKYFLPVAWIAVIINFAAIIYMLLAAAIDMFGFNRADTQGAIVKFVVFVCCIAIAVMPAVMPDKVKKNMGKIICCVPRMIKNSKRKTHN